MKTHTHTHTPGPLTATGHDGKQCVIIECTWGSVAKVLLVGAQDQETANAQLIAAAPELLAALREIESKLTALLCERVLDSTLPEFYKVRDARNSARAAIAKTEGNA